MNSTFATPALSLLGGDDENDIDWCAIFCVRVGSLPTFRLLVKAHEGCCWTREESRSMRRVCHPRLDGYEPLSAVRLAARARCTDCISSWCAIHGKSQGALSDQQIIDCSGQGCNGPHNTHSLVLQALFVCRRLPANYVRVQRKKRHLLCRGVPLHGSFACSLLVINFRIGAGACRFLQEDVQTALPNPWLAGALSNCSFRVLTCCCS